MASLPSTTEGPGGRCGREKGGISRAPAKKSSQRGSEEQDPLSGQCKKGVPSWTPSWPTKATEDALLSGHQSHPTTSQTLMPTGWGELKASLPPRVTAPPPPGVTHSWVHVTIDKGDAHTQAF